MGLQGKKKGYTIQRRSRGTDSNVGPVTVKDDDPLDYEWSLHLIQFRPFA